MTKKTRLLILLFCIICFFIIAPVLVAYSMGYRFDFESMKVVGTGGIYVRTFPAAEQIIIDSKISGKPGIFSNAIFVQSLLPKDHTVFIKKDGYYDYFKTLPVQEKEVTKLENVILIKKSLIFNSIVDEIDYFSIAPNNQNVITATIGTKATSFNYFNLNNNQSQVLSVQITGKISEIKWSDDSSKALIKIQVSGDIFYYLFDSTIQTPTVTHLPYLDKNSRQISFNPRDTKEIFYEENNMLYSLKNNKPQAIIKNLVAYQLAGENIVWLSKEGLLSLSDFSGKLINILTGKNITISPAKNYEILTISGKTFLKEDVLLFLFNPDTKILESFEAPEVPYKTAASPDNKNFIYCADNKIYLYSFLDKKYEEIFSGDKITNCQWLNNDYIISTSGDNIVISEIDYRGNINTVTLPAALDIGEDKTIEIKNPQAFFVQQSGKLYILADRILLTSEKILP